MNTTEPRSCRLSWDKTPHRTALLCAGLVGIALQLSGCATGPDAVGATQAVQEEKPSVETAYGIQVEGLRLTAAGSMLDFRYRVLDAQKAAPFLNGKVQPALLDESRGAAERGADQQAGRFHRGQPRPSQRRDGARCRLRAWPALD